MRRQAPRNGRPAGGRRAFGALAAALLGLLAGPLLVGVPICRAADAPPDPSVKAPGGNALVRAAFDYYRGRRPRAQ